MENDGVIKIKLRKYTYSFIKIPAPTDKIGGCFGCFFCNKKVITILKFAVITVR